MGTGGTLMGRVEEVLSAEAEIRTKGGATVHEGNDQLPACLPGLTWCSHVMSSVSWDAHGPS